MDKKSKVFLWIFFLLIIASVGVTFWRIMIKRDYIVQAQAACDPTTQNCFVSVCDPTTDTCTGDPDKDTTYYSLIHREAYNIPNCDPNDDSCTALTCPEGEKDCSITYCTDQTKTKDDTCSDPATYNAAHPASDDSGDSSGDTSSDSASSSDDSSQGDSGQ